MSAFAIGILLLAPPAAPAQAATHWVEQQRVPDQTGVEKVEIAELRADPAMGEEIVVSARRRDAPDDPLERVNALSFSATQRIDDAITEPAARTYVRSVPRPIRLGLRNFFSNLREPVVFANYLLQLKPGKAVETLGRFTINTTLGLGGTIDVAKRCPFNLPLRQNRFSDTLGYYGVAPGPFLFVPVAGPTTLRDVVGGMVDFFASPFALGGPFRSRPYVIGSAAVRILDRRDQKEEALRTVDASDNPYATRRTLYLRRQRERIEALHGRPVLGEPAPQRCRHPSRQRGAGDDGAA